MKIKVIGSLDNSNGTFDCCNRIYDSNGICPTIPTASGGGHIPKVMEIQVKNDNIGNQILTNEIKDGQSLEKRREEKRREEKRREEKRREEVVYIRQATKSGAIPCMIGGVADLSFPTSETRRGRVQAQGNICPTLTTENIPSVIERFTWEVDGVKYLVRIRKLTPKECFMLMDFDGSDFDKCGTVNSNTQLYKQAGNSIVVNCLTAIFGQLFDGLEDKYKEGSNQL